MGAKGILAIVLLVVLGFGGYFYLNKQSMDFDATEIKASIVAFDYDGRHKKVSTTGLLRGDALIFLKIFPNENKIRFLRTLDQLQKYDSNHKGYIALDNPNFKNFYFGRYLKRNNILEYRAFQNIGIAGIILKYDKGSVQSAQVILLDNSRRNLSTLNIANDMFNNSKLRKCHIKCDLLQFKKHSSH